jgi:hypothetical protein
VFGFFISYIPGISNPPKINEINATIVSDLRERRFPSSPADGDSFDGVGVDEMCDDVV